MKKMICLILAVLLLCGCQANVPAETTAAPETTEAPALTLPPEGTTPPTLAPNLPLGPAQAGEEIPFANPGKVRLTYTGNRSYIRYITSVAELPEEEALKGYDEAFFEDHALLIVVETVSSGSVQLEIESVRMLDGVGHVSLKRSMEGDFGTADMATWLLWAEIERDMDVVWILESDSRLPQVEKY